MHSTDTLCLLHTPLCSGVCTSCKAQLEKTLTATDHQQLLDAVRTAAHTESLGFSPELISNLSRLENQLSSVHTPYRVIVDGLNVARVSSKHFSVMQVSVCVFCVVEVIDTAWMVA